MHYTESSIQYIQLYKRLITMNEKLIALDYLFMINKTAM